MNTSEKSFAGYNEHGQQMDEESGDSEEYKYDFDDLYDIRDDLDNESSLSKLEVDLFNNKRRQSQIETSKRLSLGLPDNGRGMTKEYYNINEKLSRDELVEVIVRRRSLKMETVDISEIKKNARRPTIEPDLEERIQKTLAWKELEDEANKEDVVVQVKKKELQLRKEARNSKINSQTQKKQSMSYLDEEKRAMLRTALLQTSERRNTSDSIKSAIEDFKAQNLNKVAIVEQPETVVENEDIKISDEVIDNPRLLLEKLKSNKLFLTKEEQEIMATRDKSQQKLKKKSPDQQSNELSVTSTGSNYQATSVSRIKTKSGSVKKSNNLEHAKQLIKPHSEREKIEEAISDFVSTLSASNLPKEIINMPIYTINDQEKSIVN